jgi:hypothetical protein
VSTIGGMKRYNILVHTFRNRIEHFEDDVIGICAGLWNLVLSYGGTALVSSRLDAMICPACKSENNYD